MIFVIKAQKKLPPEGRSNYHRFATRSSSGRISFLMRFPTALRSMLISRSTAMSTIFSPCRYSRAIILFSRDSRARSTSRSTPSASSVGKGSMRAHIGLRFRRLVRCVLAAHHALQRRIAAVSRQRYHCAIQHAQYSALGTQRAGK